MKINPSAPLRSIATYIQKRLMAIDKKEGGSSLISPSHFDYQHIFIRVKSNLKDVERFIDPTSRIRMSILQQKYFLHDDHNDQEFRMDWTLHHMFSPVAKCLLKRVEHMDKKMREENNKDSATDNS